MFGDQQLKFTCPKCKRHAEKRLDELKRSDQKRAVRTKYETSDFKRGIERAEREINRFRPELDKITINLKLWYRLSLDPSLRPE
jgi:ribosomal protein L44E